MIVQGSGERENAVLKRLTCLLLMLAHAAGASSAPNVVLIVADDLGFTDLGLYGSEIPTPHLDRLGAEGVQLMNFHANASCTPSRAMLLSGRDNHAVGYGANPAAVRRMPELAARPGYRGAFPEGLALLPKRLQDVGYQTYFVGKWHLGSDPSAHPPAQGFEHSFYLEQGGGSHFADAVGTLSADEALSYWEDGMPVAALPEDFFSSTFYVDKALAYLDRAQRQDAPFLLQLSLTAPHWPLQAPESIIDKYRGDYDVGYDVIRERRFAEQQQRGLFPGSTPPPPRPSYVKPWQQLADNERAFHARNMEIYAAMVDYMDMSIGRVVDYLDKKGDLDNTIIVFISDNGAEHWDYNNGPVAIRDFAKTFNNSAQNVGREGSFAFYGAEWSHVSNTPFSRYKGTTYEGGIRSPAVVYWPAQVTQGKVSRAVVQAVDWLPTFAEVAGADISQVSGKSLAKLLAGQVEQVRSDDDVIGMEVWAKRTVIANGIKLVSSGKPNQRVDWELYDLQADPSEQTNLSSQQPELYNRMLKHWDNYALENNVILPEGPFIVRPVGAKPVE